MPGERRAGMDHEHYDWSPIVNRGVLRWPEGSRIALCVVVNLEHMEYNPPEGSFSPTLSGGVSPRPYPDYTRISHREYGHRVGVFRVLDVLEKHGIKPTIALDAMTAERYPYLVKHCLQRGCEFIGHGVSVSRMVTSRMSEGEERKYIKTSVDALKKATGTAPTGWIGPEYGESARTPQLLAEAGIRYICDWTNDEQPYRIKASQGEMFALPVMLELDDINAIWDRRVPVDRYSLLLKEGFDTLYQDSAKNGRVMVLNLHPWLIGQPFRIKYLDEALATMVARKGVWAATGSEIIDWYQRNPPVA